ncbi:MAG: hypothetical protein H7144_03105 [Burkholderiales bacterium]|nr:hypothetical protein [Phycisphaerae bacterium]
MKNTNGKITETTIEARGAVEVKGMTKVLFASLTLIAIAFFLIYVYFM